MLRQRSSKLSQSVRHAPDDGPTSGESLRTRFCGKGRQLRRSEIRYVLFSRKMQPSTSQEKRAAQPLFYRGNNDRRARHVLTNAL